MSNRVTTEASINLEGKGCPPCAKAQSRPCPTRFDRGFSAVQNGPEVGHFICISMVTFAGYYTGEMQI